MRLYAKIFLCGTVIFSTAFLLAGYLLLTGTYRNELNREKEIAIRQYQYDKFTVQSELLSQWENISLGMYEEESLFERLMVNLGEGTAFYLEKTRPLISNLPKEMDTSMITAIEENCIQYQFQKAGGKTYLLTGGKVTQDEVEVYMLRAADITTITKKHEQLVRQFQRMYILVLGISIGVMLILSVFITKPVKKMNLAAQRIARGDYEKRLKSRGSDEIAELTESFNVMTDSIEEKMDELSKELRQREDFMANFAHELKTPMTSVIGYADMLYQKELSREEVKDAAWYILNEGMRLEALSLKLMDLFVMGRQEFLLEEMEAEEVLKNVLQGMEPILKERGARLYLEAEPAYIRVEIDLFKTLIWNLIDNATKAGSSEIRVSGLAGEKYRVQVEDNGCGIPAEEIGKITEAFYMVDKSRARKQHGAGLGLALAGEIARIHGSELTIESEVGQGTRISLGLYCVEEKEDE